MIDSKELKKEFDELYNYMASSSKVENMALFGSVAKNMMYNLIDNKPSEAKEYIDKLKSMKWRNYLTDKALAIITEVRTRRLLDERLPALANELRLLHYSPSDVKARLEELMKG